MQMQTRTSTASKVAVAAAVLFAAGGIAAAIVTMTTFRRPTLDIAVSSTPISTEIVKGTEDVTFLELGVVARNGSIEITDLAFTAYGDDDANFRTVENDVSVQDHVMSCGLYQPDGTLIAGPEPIDGAGRLAFSMAWTPTSGRVAPAFVKCSFANVSPENDSPDIFGLALVSDTNVTAVDTRTSEPLPAIAVRVGGTSDPGVNANLRAQNVTLLDHGTLSARLSSDSPEPGIVLAGSSNVLLGSWTFASTGEPFAIPRLMFTNTTSITPLYELELKYEDATGSTITLTEPAGDWVYFEGLTLEVDGTSSIELYANAIRTADDSVSGNRIGYALDFDAPGFAAGGTISGVDATDAGIGDDAIPSSEFVVYATEPTMTLASGSPSGSSVPGNAETFRFNVAADSRADLTVGQIVFKIDTTDISTTGWNDCGDGTSATFADADKWNLYDRNDLTAPLDGTWTFLNASAGECSIDADPVAYAMFTLADPSVIRAGETETLSLYVDSTNASTVDDDSLRVSVSGTDELSAAHISALEWNDGYSDADETYVNALPVIGGTLTY